MQASVPTNKFIDRTLSYTPEVGIPEALSIINDPDSHRDDFIGASCYLSYRLLDGSYTDFEIAWSSLNKAITLADMMEPEPAWFRTRWQVSLALIYAYVDVVVRKNPLPRNILEKCVTEEHVTNHPLQTVNVMRAQLLLAADELFRISPVDRLLCQEIVEKYSTRAVKLFRLASEKFNLVDGKESNYVYCFSESMECLNEMVKLKYCYNWETVDPLEKIISDLKVLLVDKSKAPYRQAFISLYENRKTYSTTKKLTRMNLILDVGSKKVAYACAAKCGSRTVVGWAAAIKNPFIYNDKTNLFDSNRNDCYKDLREMVFPFTDYNDALMASSFFTIIRNPVDRFVSAYMNRILFLKKNPEITFEDFIKNYETIITDSRFSDILHHTRPLSFFCGTDPSVFTHIFNVTQMGDLKILLEKIYELKLPDIHLHKTQSEKPSITLNQLHKIHKIYEEDYAIYSKWMDEPQTKILSI